MSWRSVGRVVSQLISTAVSGCRIELFGRDDIGSASEIRFWDQAGTMPPATIRRDDFGSLDGGPNLSIRAVGLEVNQTPPELVLTPRTDADVNPSEAALLGQTVTLSANGDVPYAVGLDSWVNIQGASFDHTGMADLGPWRTPTLLNGWTNNGGGFVTVQYRPTVAHDCKVKGLIKPGTWASGTTLFTLDADMCPTSDHIFRPTTPAAGTGVCDLYVRANGNVQIFEVTGTAPAWLSLSGIQWPTVAA